MKQSNFYQWIPYTILSIGSLCLLYYLYLCITYGFNYISFSWMFLLVGILGILYGVLELKKAKHVLLLLPQPLSIIILVILTVGIACFTFIEAQIIYRGTIRDEQQEQTVIVLGAQLNGSSISRLLRYRLESALTFAKTYPDATIIVSGGQGVGENRSEASAMKEYLIQHGVAEKRILIEDKSVNTDENFAFSKTISKQSKVSVITNDFHMYRALYLCEQQGMTCSAYPAQSDLDLAPNFYLREFFAYVKDTYL